MMRTVVLSDMHHGMIRQQLLNNKNELLARAADADRTMTDKVVGDKFRFKADQVHALILLLDSAKVS